MTKRAALENSLPAAAESAESCFDFASMRIATDHYLLQDVVGRGTAGVVHRAKERAERSVGPERPDVAIKCYLTDSEHWAAVTKREIKCLKRIPAHDNILALLEVATNEDRNTIYTIMTYMPFDLHWVMRRHGETLPVGQIKGYMQQLLRGVAHMHASGVMHRDIKPQNVLVSADNVLKLADFGLACMTNKSGIVSGTAVHTSMVVTIWYRAPEILLVGSAKRARYDSLVDVWSVGAIMGEFLLGGRRSLFQVADNKDEAPERQLGAIYEICGTPRREQYDAWPEHLHRHLAGSYRYPRNDVLTNGVYMREQSKRVPICTHSAMAAMCAMLSLNPLQRSSANKVLQMPYFAMDSPKPYEAGTMLRLLNTVAK